MSEWFESGRIVDVMLIVIAIEVAVLCAYRLRTGRGLSVSTIVLNAGAGGSLMVALKLLWVDAAWHWIAMALLSSLAFHSGDLVQRWRATAA